MQDQFDNWYSGMEFSENADIRSRRWASIQSISKNPTATTLEVLTRLAFRTKLQPLAAEAGQVRTLLAEGGPALQDEEAALIAAVALALILDERDTTAARAAVLINGAACAGLRGLQQPMDLVGMAVNAQAYLSETARRRPPLEQPKPVTPQLDVTASLTVLADGNVSVILVNIFAGINRCDWVAEGVVQAYREVGLNIPVVVRLAGTNVDEGRAIIAGSGLPLISADTLAEAAAAAVAARPRKAA